MTADEKTGGGFSRQPMVLLAVSFALGILTGKYLPFVSISITATAIAIFVLGGMVARRLPLATPLVALAFVGAGLISYTFEVERNTASDRIRTIYDKGVIASGSPVEIEGVLTRSPEAAVEGYFLTVRSDSLLHRGAQRITAGSVRLFVKNLKLQISDLKYGSRIRVLCHLEREDTYRNPGVTPRLEILDRMGVDATCIVKSPLLIEHLADESVFLPVAWVYEQRSKLIEEFRKDLSPKAAGVMIASLLGNKHFLDKDTADLFRDGGTFHILVISGLHITFIGGLLLWVIRQFTRRRALQFVVTNAVLWAYTLAVGADVPVVRAAVMFTILSFSYVIYRQNSVLNSLAACALILLVWRPSDLFNPSFQLTFASVIAIVACAFPLLAHLRAIGEWTPSAGKPFPPNVPFWLRRICETLYWRDAAWKVEAKRNIWTANLLKLPYMPRKFSEGVQTIVRYLFEGLVVSLVVQLWMLPLTVVYFHRVSIIAIVLNLWVGFFIALESFAAVAGALAESLNGLLAAGFYASAEVFNWLMLTLPRLFVDNGWLSFRLPAYGNNGRVVYFLYSIPILLFVFALARWRPFDLRAASPRVIAVTALTLIVLIAIVIHSPFIGARADGRLRVDFLDVGQGDAIFIRFPNGKTMLVDGGGRFDYRDKEGDVEPFDPDVADVGEMAVSPVLWDRGHSRIDHVLITHPHADHIGGLMDVAKNFEIGSAIVGEIDPNAPEQAELATTLQNRAIPVETVARGDVLEFGDCRVEILNPPANITGLSENDRSVVLRIVFGGRLFLLTGDIEQAAESMLAADSLLTADVVKVPHHGSRSSSTHELVNATQAKYAVISVGRRSNFGHPHTEVVERWQGAGAIVLTTGTSGMISISTDGRDLRAEQFCEDK